MSGELDEIWALYADDGAQSLDAMETSLACLRGSPADTEAVGSLFRAMHTFKGNSRILGLAAIEAVAHAAEDLVGLVRDDGVVLDQDLSNLLLEAMDVLRGMMEQALDARADTSSARSCDLLDRMKSAYALRRAGSEPGQAAAMNEERVAEQHSPAEDEFSEAMIFDAQAASFADDPLYREIFFDIVKTSLEKILAVPSDESARALILAELLEIRDAALRIGIADWPERADAAIAAMDDAAAFATALQALRAASAAEAGAGTTESEAGPHEAPQDWEGIPAEVLGALQELLRVDLSQDGNVACDMALTLIDAWAQDALLPGIADACRALRQATGVASRAGAIYILGDGISRMDCADPSHARLLLDDWCAARADDTLAGLAQLAQSCDPQQSGLIFSHLQMFSSACRHRGWTVPAEAAQALADVTGRLFEGDVGPPSTLAHLAVAFAGISRALWDISGEAAASMHAALEKLLHETAKAASVLLGEVPPHVVVPEGLSPELAKSLSPESLVAIEGAQANGHYLHVVRCDTGDDDALGGRLADLLMAPGMSSIASATIFAENRTLFDFLIATERSAADIDVALRAVDPDGNKVHRTATLHHDAEPEASEAPHHLDEAFALELGEAIGSFAVAHSCIRQTLNDCIEADLPSSIDRILGSDLTGAGAVRERIGHVLDDWQQKLQQMMQVEVQASLELERLADLAARSASASQSSGVIDAMVVRIEQVQYVMPFQAIDQIITFPASKIVRVSAAGDRSVISLQNGELADLLDLRSADGGWRDRPVQQGAAGDEEVSVQLVVSRSQGRAIAVFVDELIGQQTVHPRPLSGYLGGMRGVAGYAILKTGDVGMLLDVSSLAVAA